MLKELSKYIKDNNKVLSLTLGELSVIKQLGQGGNGLVYKGRVLGKEVAVKFLVSEQKGESGKNVTT